MAEGSGARVGRRMLVRVIAVVSLLVVVAALWAYATGQFERRPTPPRRNTAVTETTDSTEPSLPPPPPEYPCPLCGEKVKDRTLVERRPIVAKIENSPAARPQSGLLDAEVVYEFLAEGGITRFAAVFLSHDATVAGPIRSARFADTILSLQYDALFAHCGGSAPVLAELRRAGVTDLDEFRYSKRAYWRDSSRRRPHNLYTSTDRLRAVARTEGFERAPRIRGFRFRETTPVALTSTPTAISVFMSDINVSVWRFDPATNTYRRFHGSRPHLDRETGRQVYANNVIVMYVVQQTVPGLRDSHRNPVFRFILEGSGEAVVFQSGTVIRGTWRATRDDTPIFYDASGREIELNPGITWIEALPRGRKYTVTPAS